jgi:uncharacterized membrane protein YccF (DUF307 family)
VLNAILNVVWLILEGLWMAIGYAIAGIICFILIVTIPFGIASFRIAGYVLWPFGQTIERRPEAGAASMIGNVLWIILFGWWLALGHLIVGVAMCITIIGIPLGIANFKIIPVTLVPLGVRIVPSAARYADPGPGYQWRKQQPASPASCRAAFEHESGHDGHWARQERLIRASFY